MAIIDPLAQNGRICAEATITKLVVDAGAQVEADDPIVEIATDKVDSEVPAPEDGALVEWCVAEGDVVQVGAVIARYDVVAKPVKQRLRQRRRRLKQLLLLRLIQLLKWWLRPWRRSTTRHLGKRPSGRFYSPCSKHCQKRSIAMAEVEQVPGTGSEGQVTKKDILAYIASRGAAPAAPVVAPARRLRQLHPLHPHLWRPNRWLRRHQPSVWTVGTTSSKWTGCAK